MYLWILYIVGIRVCHMYNETIFEIISCDTEQSWDGHALSKKKKKTNVTNCSYCMCNNMGLIKANIWSFINRETK